MHGNLKSYFEVPRISQGCQLIIRKGTEEKSDIMNRLTDDAAHCVLSYVIIPVLHLSRF